MKLKHARKNKAGISLTKNSIVMIVMLVVIVLATMAWFTLSRYAEAVNVVSGTEKTEHIMFALEKSGDNSPVGEEYFGHLQFQDKINELLTGSGNTALETFNQEITGDGRNFYVPEEFVTINNVVTVKDGTTYRTAVANKDYVSLTFYVRTVKSDEVKNLCISKNSHLDTGKAPLTALLTDGTTDDSEISENKKSIYGDFSRNGIGGAVRVSLIEHKNDNTENVKFIWIPRPDLSLQWKSNGFVLYKGVADNTYGTYDHNYYTAGTDKLELVDADSQGINVVTSVVNSEDYDAFPKFAEDIVVSDNNNTFVSDAEYDYYKFTLNLWLEGTDPESAAPLNGGSFRLYMNFNQNKTSD